MKTEFVRRVGAFALALTLAAGVSGCGKDGPSVSNTDISQSQAKAGEKPGTQKQQSGRTEAYIQSAIDAAEGLKQMDVITAPDGTRYAESEYIPIYLNANGDVYVFDTLMGENIADYALTNVDLYMLSGDQLLGKEDFALHYFNVRSTDPLNPVDCTDRLVHLGAANGAELTEIFAEHNQLWGLDTKGRVFTLDRIPEYDDDGEPNWDFMKWTKLAVFDTAYQEDSWDDLVAFAGIKRDGEVVASGEWADEILGWGPLAYITMQNDIAVGLTKDGELKLAGPRTQNLESVLSQWHNITGVYACNDGDEAEIKAVDADGNFYWCKYEYYRKSYVFACKITSDGLEILAPDPERFRTGKFESMLRIHPDGKCTALNQDTLEWAE